MKFAPTIPATALRGVNLGNWLLLERWMHPAAFAGTKAHDEYALSLALGEDAERVLRNHRETWITEADFAWLAGRGINAVRIPFGYWVLEADGPFVASPERLDFAVDCCEKYGMSAVLDLHGVPGFQGAEHHSGRSGYFRWPRDASYVARSLDVIEHLAQRYAGRHGVAAVSLVNEPDAAIDRDALVAFYHDATERVRRHMAAEEVAVVVSAYPENRLDDYHRCLGATPAIWTDVHYYQSFVDWSGRDEMDYLAAVIERQSRVRAFVERGPIVVGEWSLSWPASLEARLKSLGEGRRDLLMRAYADLQLACYEETAGWFFWSYRVTDRPAWSFRDAVDRGWLPSEFKAPVGATSPAPVTGSTALMI